MKDWERRVESARSIAIAEVLRKIGIAEVLRSGRS